MANKISDKFSPELRVRTTRMALEHEKHHPSRWAAMRLEPIGNILPAEAEDRYYAAADQIGMAV